MDPIYPLPAQTIHVWYTLAPKELAKDQIAGFLALLTPDERIRHDRFIQEKDRRQYLLGKVLVRTVLSQYLGSSPETWLFSTNRFGKPVLANPPSAFVPRFNLSHTEGLVACAIARDFEVGIDVENVGRPINLEIARRFFAPAEVTYLEQVPEHRRQATFFLFWTLKESYVKARGIGLSLPLEQFAFCLDQPQSPTITFEPAMNEDPARWQFLLPNIGSSVHQMAVAAQCGAGREAAITLGELAL